MKPVLAWVKKNLIAVICAVIAVIVLPTSIVLSSGWTSKVREEAKKRASDELTKVNSNKVSYALPAVLPGVSATALSAEPNAKVTEYLKGKREQLLKEAGAISSKAEAINKRSPLIEGFFPRSKSPEEQQSKGLEFADIIVGGKGRPSAYKKLFDAVKAGEPPEAARVAVQLRDAREREEDRIKAGQKDRVLTPSENEEILKRLVDQRLTEYRKRASEISFYGSPEQLLPAEEFLRQVPALPPTPFQAFKWQWDLWLIEDILAAISKANGVDQGRIGVDGSVVKRVSYISVKDQVGGKLTGTEAGGPASGGRDDRGAPGGPPQAPAGDPKALVPPNFGASITGRYNLSSNQVYSVRSPRVELVVSAARLPELFNAFASVNFMTIDGDFSLSAVDPWKDLEEGYYYGEEPVVKISFRVESIYLRSWLAPIMPEQARRVLNVAYTEPKTDEKAGGPQGGAQGGPQGAPKPPPPPPPSSDQLDDRSRRESGQGEPGRRPPDGRD